MRYPPLQPGRVYTHEEVRPYLAPGDPDDFVKAAQYWQPRDLERGVRLHTTEPMRVEYAELPVETLERQIAALHADFSRDPGQLQRIQDILDLLRGGAVAFPVF